MRLLAFLSFSSLAASAALDTRDPVPAGYVAPPYYPSEFKQPVSTLLSDLCL
jgi:hypothetical protein